MRSRALPEDFKLNHALQPVQERKEQWIKPDNSLRDTHLVSSGSWESESVPEDSQCISTRRNELVFSPKSPAENTLTKPIKQSPILETSILRCSEGTDHGARLPLAAAAPWPALPGCLDSSPMYSPFVVRWPQDNFQHALSAPDYPATDIARRQSSVLDSPAAKTVGSTNCWSSRFESNCW